MDVGSGDGRGPYRWASRERQRLFVASDANPDVLRDIAWRAGRKASRGGLSNLLCIAESLSVLAGLGAIADRISVFLPWGELLRTVAGASPESLRHLAQLGLLNATVDVVFSYEQHDSGSIFLPGLESLTEPHLRERFPAQYAEAGLRIVEADRITHRALANLGTTWSRRLAFGRPRDIWRIRAVVENTSRPPLTHEALPSL